MLFPYRDENPTERFPLVNLSLIIINGMVFIHCVTSGRYEEIIYDYGFYATHPTLPSVITSAFLHGGFAHLLGNMWFLWIFGDNVEDRLGRFLYLVLYFASALAAALLHTLTVQGETAAQPLVGASGAVSGVLAAYLVFFPWAKINFFYWFYFFFYGVVQIPALLVIGFWFLEQFALASFTQGQAFVSVAYWAHVGGFGLGFALAGPLRLVGAIRTPKDVLLQNSPRFRRALFDDDERLSILPSQPDPLRQRMREALRVRATTLAHDRAARAEQLLLRALDKHDPARIARYYSLFEQAFPSVTLEEEHQWEVARALDSLGHDTLALEAYRKIVDSFPEGRYWAQACLRVGQLYHLHRNYTQARRYLTLLRELMPASAWADQATEELQAIERTLQAESPGWPDAAQRPQGPYLILRQTRDPIDASAVGDLIAEVTGESKLDARGRVARGQGVLVEGLDLSTAQTLTRKLQQAGIPVLMIAEEQLMVYPAPLLARRAELSDQQAVFYSGGQAHRFDWKDLWLLSCAQVRTTRTISRERPVVAALVRPYGASPRAKPKAMPETEERKVRVLDLFWSRPFVQVRVWEDQFNYDYLPAARKAASRALNFPLLVKDVVRWAPQAHVGPGVDRLMSEESFEGLTFASTKELDRYNFWLVQLCHLSAEAPNPTSTSPEGGA